MSIPIPPRTRRAPDPNALPWSRDRLPPEALRALDEAEERRRTAVPLTLAPELDGRDGPEPVRYGDYEKAGIAVDF